MQSHELLIDFFHEFKNITSQKPFFSLMSFTIHLQKDIFLFDKTKLTWLWYSYHIDCKNIFLFDKANLTWFWYSHHIDCKKIYFYNFDKAMSTSVDFYCEVIYEMFHLKSRLSHDHCSCDDHGLLDWLLLFILITYSTAS